MVFVLLPAMSVLSCCDLTLNKRLFTLRLSQNRRGCVKRAESVRVESESAEGGPRSGRAASARIAAAKSEPPSVRQRILLVAERMFAEHGMEGVGLRAITAAAKVNLASIAYHFGSKEGLLEALFAQRAAPIAQERLRLLDLCFAGGKKPTLEQILDAFLRPALTLGVAAAIRRARLRQAARAARHRAGNDLAQDFGEGLRPIEPQVHRRHRAALPQQPRAEIEWRYHFMLGAMFYTMANSGRIQALTNGRCDPGDVKRALHHMIPFLAAGFRSAPVS